MGDELGVLEKMERFEMTLGALYKLFADHFPQGRQFWMRLAVEEKAHASHLQMLAEKVKAGELGVDPAHLALGPMEEARDELLRLIETFQDSPLELTQAATISIDIENEIFDKQFYAVFNQDSEPVRRIFRILEAEAKMHAQRARDFLGGIERFSK
jgi:hypothetical protein